MRANIVLVGCGFLGSIFAEECVKRWFALHDPLELTLVDDDSVDDRNPANHNFTLEAIDRLKAEALCDRLAEYETHGNELILHPVCRRIGPKDAPAFLEESDLIVDAVDNLPTRQWLWELGVKGTPVLHLGVSQVGTGAVEWTINEYDTFGLSPVALAHYTAEQTKELTTTRRLPPCDLVRFRGLGLNVALAGAKAAGIAFGIDPEDTLSPRAKQALTSWSATNTGHSLRETERVS